MPFEDDRHEPEASRLSHLKKTMRNWFQPWQSHESALLKQVLRDYVRVIEEAERERQRHTQEIAELKLAHQSLLGYVYDKFDQQVARLKRLAQG